MAQNEDKIEKLTDSLIDEIRGGTGELRSFLARQFALLLRDQRFLDALPGHLPPDPSSQARLLILQERLQTIAAVG